jgi:glycosyltransferase involved in cell wall biosynthesis
MRVCVVTRSFPPSFLCGGPARSLDGLVEALHGQCTFRVVTAANDCGHSEPMEGVQPDVWSSREHCRVKYLSKGRQSSRRVVQAIRESQPECVYFNSFFDLRFFLLPAILLLLTRHRCPIVVAPRGELSEGALAHHFARKKALISTVRFLKLGRRWHWHASTELEAEEIRRTFPEASTVLVARNLRRQEATPEVARQRHGVCFVSRIVPKKNLLTAIRSVGRLSHPTTLRIAGPVSDTEYWAECQAVTRQLPHPETIEYVGPIDGSQVIPFLAEHELLVFPTYGENFGHVVLEALLAGTPVIVGKDTPWGALERVNAGWLCEPDDAEGIGAIVEQYLLLPEVEKVAFRRRAQALGLSLVNDSQAVADSLNLFARVTAHHP